MKKLLKLWSDRSDKQKYIVLNTGVVIAVIALIILLTGCLSDEKPSTTQYPTQTPTGDHGDTSTFKPDDTMIPGTERPLPTPDGDIVQIDRAIRMVNSSKPNKITIVSEVEYPSIGVKLIGSGSMVLTYDGDTVSSKYAYSCEKLNEIDSDSSNLTHVETKETSGDGSEMFVNGFEITESNYTRAFTSIKDGVITFTGELNEGISETVIGMQGATGIVMTIVGTDTGITSFSVNYTSKTGASVKEKYEYFYN